MDESRFKEAQQAFAAGDWRAAAKGFLASADQDSMDNGAAYHLAGNALMRLRRNADAATVYQHALADRTYAKRGAVRTNLGAALLADGLYAEAEKAYAAALSEPGYETPYKAQQGRAGALFEMRKFAEAAESYRAASMDPDNPDPGRALNNLGSTYLSQGKWSEAVDAYRAALRFDSYRGKGTCLSNLGLAYAAGGMHAEAVAAFKSAVEDFGHKLSEQAELAYRSSLEATKGNQVVEGWETGEQPAVIDDPGATMTFEAIGAQVYGPPGGDEEPDPFFTRTDDEMRELDRQARRAERDARRGGGGAVKTIVGMLGVIALLGALVGGAWFTGFGWPSQGSTVKGLLETYKSGGQVEQYWVAAPSSDIGKEMSALPPKYVDYSIDDVEREPASSVVGVTVTLEKGAPMHYQISLSREGVGWKVDGIKYDWRSTGGGS